MHGKIRLTNCSARTFKKVYNSAKGQALIKSLRFTKHKKSMKIDYKIGSKSVLSYLCIYELFTSLYNFLFIYQSILFIHCFQIPPKSKPKLDSQNFACEKIHVNSNSLHPDYERRFTLGNATHINQEAREDLKKIKPLDQLCNQPVCESIKKKVSHYFCVKSRTNCMLLPQFFQVDRSQYLSRPLKSPK